jgi:hypothetical protein
MSQLEKLYTAAEVANHFGRSLDWVYDKVKAGHANPMRTAGPGSPMLWAETDIAELKAALRPTPTPQPTRRRRRRRYT